MTARYQTLDVSLNLNNSAFQTQSPKKFSSTIDFGDKSQLSNIGQNDDRVNKFRQLYFKNQKLRQQLKLLNVKLNEKLQKVKLMPSKRKKAMSVDLNVQKPTKALQRQLQNAYNQIAMYKKQIVTLKVKQQSESTYEKYKTMENQISFRDIQINKVQLEIKAIKNVKKMQDKTLTQDLENQDMKDKHKQLERQFKQGQQKLKDIAKKARKRQQQYKKQQAYQVALEKKLRKNINQEPQQEQDQLPMGSNNKQSPRQQQQQVSEKDFITIKQQIQKYKIDNEALQKKLELHKKTLRDLKKNKNQNEQKYKEYDIELKGHMLKLQSYRRLIRDIEKKGSEKDLMTGYVTTNQIQKKGHVTKRLSSTKQNNLNQIESEDPPSDQESYMNYDKKLLPFNISQAPSTIKQQREWNGKTRKVNFGYMDSNDSLHKISGIFKGLRVWTDDSKLICGMNFVSNEEGIDKQSGVIGTRTQNQVMFFLQPNDKLGHIDGSFTDHGYLGQFSLVSTMNFGTTFGTEVGSNKFNSRIEQDEKVTGISCAVRKLGKDTRITELGLWLNKI